MKDFSVNIWEPLPARMLKEYKDTVLSDPLEVVVVVLVES